MQTTPRTSANADPRRLAVLIRKKSIEILEDAALCYDLSVLEVEDAKGETRSESDQVVHFSDAPGEERVEILDM